MKQGAYDDFRSAIMARTAAEGGSINLPCVTTAEGRCRSARTRLACKDAIDHIAMSLMVSRSGAIVEANGKFYEASGYTAADILGASIRNFMFDPDLSGIGRALMSAIRNRGIWRGEIGFLARHGSIVWSDMTVTAPRTPCGSVGSFILLGLDITERKRAEFSVIEERRRREDTESLLKDIVDAVPSGIVAYDKVGKVIFFNEAHRKLYQSTRQGFANGHDRRSLVTPQTEPFPLSPKPRRRKAAVAGGCCRSFIQKLAGDRWIQIQNRRSQAGHIISVQTDVTGLKLAEKHIKEQATRDPLTGLSNRAELFGRLARFRKVDRAITGPCALLLIDLDDFKGINDTYGHDAGDTFLRLFAANLKSALRRGDVAARLGGDEFAVLLPGMQNPDQIVPVVERLRRAIAAPVSIGHRTLIPSASIGVACFPRDGIEPRDLMKSADHALYHCKQNGRGGFALYDMSMRRQAARRAYLSEELREALDRKSIEVVLQPQRDMTNGRHCGFEVLVRWSLMGEAIPPAELISIAEEAGLVTRLSYQVIDQAAAIVARIKACGFDPGIVAFNTVAAQLYDPDFPRKLLAILKGYGISPSDVELEVTENVILDRSADVIAKAIHDLHAMGFGIALDDFGTGYASLTHLKRFPLDRLKIDRSFVSGFAGNDGGTLANRDDFIISRTIVSLAHNLGLKVVAEGIETARQYEELSNIGCDFAQGYLVGHPMNEVDLITYLAEVEQSYYI
jgi:diguanylate cyclase (GGDEF)-like protein/PAS domain S-box-containing protein